MKTFSRRRFEQMTMLEFANISTLTRILRIFGVSHASNEAWNPIGRRFRYPDCRSFPLANPMEIDRFPKAKETLRRYFPLKIRWNPYKRSTLRSMNFLPNPIPTISFVRSNQFPRCIFGTTRKIESTPSPR